MNDNFPTVGDFLSIKDKEINYYSVIRGMCKRLLHNPSEDDKDAAWKYLDYLLDKNEGARDTLDRLGLSKDETLFSFAEVTLKVIENPRVKKYFKKGLLKKRSLGRVEDFFHEEKQIIDGIFRLNFGEADKLLMSKPMVMKFTDSLSSQSAVQIGAVEDEKIKPNGKLPSEIASTEADNLSFDVAKMKKDFPDFSANTAIKIIKAIPIAKGKWEAELSPGQFGPKWINKEVFLTPSTVGKYLKVLYENGMRTVDGVPIPHRFINSTR